MVLYIVMPNEFKKVESPSRDKFPTKMWVSFFAQPYFACSCYNICIGCCIFNPLSYFCNSLIYPKDSLTKEIEALIVSIKRTDSRPAIKSLYKESHSSFMTIFDEFTSSPSSAVTSALNLFALCFECLSLFVKHKVTKDDGTPDEDDIEVILHSSFIKKMIDSFLPSMIRIEDILRVKREEMEKEEKEEEKEEEVETGEAGVSSITMTLFRILYDSTDIVDSLCNTVYPKISTLLSKMFILGLSEKLEDSFVADILQTCRNIAFSEDDLTKNSLLSILPPHILPWMKKYPDKKFFFLWMNILKNITSDKGNIGSDKDRSSQLWFIFHPILDIIKDSGSKGISFDDDAVIRCLNILQTCRNIAFSEDDLTKNSLLSILPPHILPWMKKYPDKKFFFLWMNILKNITSDKGNIGSDKDRSSQLWFIFHPILDIIKDSGSKGISFDDDAVIRCLSFFGNLSCIPSQAIEMYDCIKDGLIDSWFEMVKRKKSEGGDANSWGVKDWSKLISILSTVPALVLQLSPKFDDNMEWCNENGRCGGYDTNMEWCKKNRRLGDDYVRYLCNCYPSLMKWNELVETIKKCPDSESSSILYHEYREDIFSVFLAFQSKSEIEENKREIVLCFEYLRWVAGHDIAKNHIFLPIPDLNNLIETFIDHISKVEEVLEEDVDKEYCSICANYSFKYSERGSKKKLGYHIVINLLKTLRNISISRSLDTRSSILTLIKPYAKDWLMMYNDSECYQHWMIILSHITLSCDNTSPNTSLCSEAWPLFHPVIDVVKREFVGDMIVEDNHERVLILFSNLCCDPGHIPEIYDNVKDRFDEWWRVMKRKEHKWGIKFWSKLISMFSIVPSIIPQLSPKYDANMLWCREKRYCPTQFFNQYISNISSFLPSSYLSSTLLPSVPIVSFIPSIETSLCPEKDGYSYSSHVCSVMKLHKTIPYHRKTKDSCYHDIISGKEIPIQIQHVLKRDRSSSQNLHLHSSLIQYTPPQHLLVRIPFDDERSLRQSAYDLIERTGGGVEVMFEQGSLCCSFEEYDQEAWRKRMKNVKQKRGKGQSKEGNHCQIV
ncbi:hypothetical protein ADUPG1_006204 [Aduncisulcus paluster]|uniref:Uncharacterized protein n=1 Tax=Aduncisulcus paluster TaxID=2918883 RepID=A0ABQ5KH73_9EUKA|nr:hypothetical protein ADUPG1_006204 [Aduncisulcus paluster]